MHGTHHVNKGQPNNLAPEDIEFILQRYATDIVNNDPDFNYPVGYDERNGWGRLNAFESVRRVEGPKWQVLHSSGDPNNTSIETETDLAAAVSVPTSHGITPGIYYADQRAKITNSYTHTLSPTTQLIDIWERPSSTLGTSGMWTDSYPWANITNVDVQGNTVTVTIETFVWHFSGLSIGPGGTIPVDIWFPVAPEEARTAHSLHLCDNQTTNVEDIKNFGSISVAPNPANNEINVQYEFINSIPHTIQLLDATGRMVLTKNVGPEKSNSLSMNISNISSGVYICQILTDTGIIAQKIVKQ